MFSVIVPCFNQGHFLNACLESVARATSERHEVIVVNDGSTARATLSALQRLRPYSGHQVVRRVNQANAGLSGARNTGLDLVAGRYIKFLDADDMLIPGSLDRQARHLFDARGDHPGEPLRTSVSLGGYRTFDDASGAYGRPADQANWSRGLTFARMAKKWERGLSVPIHSALFAHDVLDRTVRFDTRVSSKEDWLFWMQLLSRGIRPIVLGEDVAIYRTHAQSMTRASEARNAHAWLQASFIARETWPDEFTADILQSSLKHFSRFYGLRLWRSVGPDISWQFFSHLALAPQSGAQTESGGSV